MNKVKYAKLLGTQHANAVKAANLRGTISRNQDMIKQAKADKQAGLRAKDPAASSTAQFTIDSLGLEEADLEEKVKELKTAHPSEEETDAAWKDDLIENPEYLAELSMFRAAAALYDAVCVRAKREYGEWNSYANALSHLLPNDGFHMRYTADSPFYRMQIRGYDKADSTIFHDPNGESVTFDQFGIDGLIELLQKIKTDGVDSVL